MKDNAHDDNRDFEELRRLLMGSELEELEQLRNRLGSPELFSSEVGEILPQAMLKSSEHGEELSEAMVPTVEEIVRLSIKKDINKFADALFPVIGPAIRKSIRETFRQMMQSLNQTLEHSFSWQGFKWRMESARTGIPFAQIALLHGLIYRVEQVFLIHRETGLLLCDLSQQDIQKQNPDLVSSMLSAINDFVGDSFEAEANRNLNSIDVGDISIWIEAGPDSILAVAIRGEAPNDLRETMQQCLEQVQAELGDSLTGFNGDTSQFEKHQDILDICLQAQYRVKNKSKGLPLKPILVLLLLVFALAYWSFSTWQQASLEDKYIAGLKAEPGFVITDSYSENGLLVVQGLRDPLAADPNELLAKAESFSAEVEHQFKPYQSLDNRFVAQRAQQILNPPDGVSIELIESRLLLKGIVDLEWRRNMQSLIPLIAGIVGVDDSDLQTRFAPALLDPPEGVKMQLESGVLYVEGAADQDWIASLQQARHDYQEISSVDQRALINLSEVKLVELIAELESQLIFFDIATSFDFDSIDTPKITQLVKNIISLSSKVSRNVLIVVRGYSDSVGSFEDNVFLSEERADYVAQAIFNAGISPRYIAVKGLEKPVPVETSEAEKRYNRRVGFEVIIE